jgi:hypothetical protein
MPAAPKLRYATLVAAIVLFVVFVLVFLFFVLVFILVFILVVIGIDKLENSQRQRLAKQIAFNAHPYARDVVVLDLHHGERVAPGLENDDVARL